jgi:protein-tyrosine sulfotransferase
MKSPPVFVLGCDRSGTSLLRRILNAHSNIACPTETKFIYQFVKVYETFQSRTGIKNMGFSEKDILDQMARFILHFLNGYAQANNKKRWVEKTTHNVNCAFTIDKIFSGTPLYIAIVRHGLDVAYSFATLTFDTFTVIDKYRYDGADTPMAAIRHWTMMNQKIAMFHNYVGDRLILVKYEELTNESERILRKLCKFLGEPWDEGMLNYNERNHDSGWEDPNAIKLPTIVPNSGGYKDWPLVLQRRLFYEARDMFEYFDYKL